MRSSPIPRFRHFVIVMVAVVTVRHLAAEEPAIDYQREVRPILAEHCALCHGGDAKQRQGELRLDLSDAARKGGESGLPAVVAGQPEASELVRRITSTDPDEVMPPPSHNKPLSASQVAKLTRWIKEGAVYESHWAFVAPRKTTGLSGESAHPVDRIVIDHLRSRGLNLAPPAPSAVLCRRVYLDLVGLPPNPQDLADFELHGLEATVDRLLRSEAFGEKWARPWLDLARYSDTNGYEKDLRREQWVWRDWVVDAMNRDLPYDRFVIEQIAGDLLPDASQEALIATGFLRNSMINEEGAIVPEQFRMVEMFDRLDCLGKAVLGLTTQCAQCHSHKFDPITQEEYYGMFAFLNNTFEAQSWIHTSEQRARIDELRGSIRKVEDRIRSERPQWETEFAEWQAKLASQQGTWEPLDAIELGSISGLNHPTQEADHSILMKGHTSADVFMIAQPDLTGATGIRLEGLTHRDLPHDGPGRSRLGTWAISEFEVLAKPPDGKDWEKVKLTAATADFSEPEQKQADSKKASGPVAHLIDGLDETTWNADRGVGRRNQPSVAVVRFEQPLAYPPGTQFKLVLRMTDMLGCCRFSITRQPSPAAPPIDHRAMMALGLPSGDRTAGQSEALFTAWRNQIADLSGANAEIEALWKAYPEAPTSVLHLAERESGAERRTYLLDRGNWDQPLGMIEPHTPASLHRWPEGAPVNRLGFAQWLASPESPLMGRVAVNRIWQAIFGSGLIETPEDFGTRSAVPEYLELLDWLAVDFAEHGWSQKHVIRTIVTSRVYQQSSVATASGMEQDPRNALLARGPRFRADAEVVRDIALSVSGLLTDRRGGPPIIPPVPQNVLDYNYTYPDYWKPAEGPERYRRTLYGFRKRSMPDPVMSNFDGPNGDTSCARRVRSNTPLAALTGLNETIFVEAARALALRVLREGGATDQERMALAYRLCTARPPTPGECDILVSLMATTRQRVADGWLNPREMTTGDAAKLPELPPGATPQDAAAWMVAARVLLNLDETLSKN